jgi:hypothetical protein
MIVAKTLQWRDIPPFQQLALADSATVEATPHLPKDDTWLRRDRTCRTRRFKQMNVWSMQKAKYRVCCKSWKNSNSFKKLKPKSHLLQLLGHVKRLERPTRLPCRTPVHLFKDQPPCRLRIHLLEHLVVGSLPLFERPRRQPEPDCHLLRQISHHLLRRRISHPRRHI